MLVCLPCQSVSAGRAHILYCLFFTLRYAHVVVYGHIPDVAPLWTSARPMMMSMRQAKARKFARTLHSHRPRPRSTDYVAKGGKVARRTNGCGMRVGMCPRRGYGPEMMPCSLLAYKR